MRHAIWNHHCVKCWIWFFLSKNSEFPFWDSIMLSLLILTFFSIWYFPDFIIIFSSISSGAQSCLTLCDPMDCSMPGFPVYHQLPELAQTQVHRVGDSTQPSHPLSSSSPHAFNIFSNTFHSYGFLFEVMCMFLCISFHLCF